MKTIENGMVHMMMMTLMVVILMHNFGSMFAQQIPALAVNRIALHCIASGMSLQTTDLNGSTYEVLILMILFREKKK